MVSGLRAKRLAWPAAGIVVFGSILAASDPASARLLKARPANAPLLAACHFSEDTDAYLPFPVFDGLDLRQLTAGFAKSAQKNDSAKADDDGEEEEDDDDEEEETEDSEPPVRNFIAAHARSGLQRGPCYKISGAATYSVTLNDGTNGVSRASDRLLKEARTTFGLQMIEDLPIGRFRAAIELDWSSAAGTSSGSANSIWMSLGPVTLGLKGSHFDFWAGDEFGFRATAPSASTFLSSLALRTSEKSTLVLSAEDPITRRLAGTGYGGVAVPDFVARWQYENDSTTLHLGGALRQLRFEAPTRATRYGYAAIVGVQRQIAWFGTGDYVIAQLTYADTAPGFLGIAQPGGLLNFTLPRNASVVILETMRGWTAALAYSHGWSTTWRSNAFATYVDLQLADGPVRGQVQVGRAALNLVWTPFTGLDFTWELGAGQIYRADTNLALTNIFKRRSYSGQFAVSRKF
ncbi:hypothetical protein [Rhabdaerophilum sp. SD176]|uniref:hypothetical protein n=1 Tax=Rhabdaerophilum sp. SD176 TaxID=2983548 RepID=UPI0024DF9B89|nr:hypothetical protein [Rhabdaerophilum sp. SD176]